MMGWLSFSEEERAAIFLSLQVASVATIASLLPATALAYILAHKNFIGKSLLNGLVHLPLILPPVVTGYVLLILFGKQGAIGQYLWQEFHFTFAFRWTGACLAAAVMSFPLLVRAIRLSFEATPRPLVQMAQSLGASPFYAFITISLPLALPGLLAGSLLCFAKSMGEFGATITFVSNIPGETQTLPSAIYSYTQMPGGDGPALKLTMISVIVALGAVFIAEILNQRLIKKTVLA